MGRLSDFAADQVIECLDRFDTLDAFMAWATGGTGAVTVEQPVPGAGGNVLYVTPRPAVMEIDAGLLGHSETRRQAWDELNAHPGRTLEGALETMRRAASAATGDAALRRTATRKWSALESSLNSHTNRHVSFDSGAFLGPVPRATRRIMESPVVRRWLGDGVRAKQLHLYYGDFRNLANHKDIVRAGGALRTANLLLQLGGPSVMRLGEGTSVERTVGSVLSMSGAARGSIRHGLEGDRDVGSMSVIFNAPNERMAQASIVLSVVGTLASAIVLHTSQGVQGSESVDWTPGGALQLCGGLDLYDHAIFNGVELSEAGRRGGLATQQTTPPARLKEIRSAGGRASVRANGQRMRMGMGWPEVARAAAAIVNVNKAKANNGYAALRRLDDNQWDTLEDLHPALCLVRQRMGWDVANRRWALDEAKSWQGFRQGMNDDKSILKKSHRSQANKDAARARLEAVEVAVKYAESK